MMLVIPGASGFSWIFCADGEKEACLAGPSLPLPSGRLDPWFTTSCTSTGVVTRFAGGEAAASGFGVTVITTGGPALGPLYPSKFARLGGCLHKAIAFEHSMPLWFLMAQTRLCLSV